jgi:hypothetical protein
MDQQNEQEMQEQLDFSQPDFVFQPKEQHDWRQQGPYLVCKSCEIEHAVFIGTEKIMVGLNESGQPIFKNR